MSTPVALVVHPLASDELDAAEEWYAERDAAAATRFRSRIEAAFALIRSRPRACPPWPGNLGRQGIRKCAIRGFPFVLPYQVVEEGIFVIAVAHTRRRPGYWLERRRR